MPRIPDFATTMWTELARARDREPEALGRLLGRYRAPVVGWLRARGLQDADAQDLAQAVLQRIVERDLLAKAEREKGRFRWLLLGIARNVLREETRRRGAQKRGGGAAPWSLDLPEVADGVGAPEEEEEAFDRAWVANLVEQALAAVRDADRARGSCYVELLRAAALEGAGYDALADRFGLRLHDVKNYLFRARKRVGAQIRRMVRGYCSSGDEYAAELEFVGRFLARKDPAP